MEGEEGEENFGADEEIPEGEEDAFGFEGDQYGDEG